MLEGGFDERGRFVHIPLGDIQRMSEYFRRVVINFFLKKELLNVHLATRLINWKHSVFSVDHSIRVPAFSIEAREALSQYIARPPLSLKKIRIEENGVGTEISFSSDSEFFNGLYASRTKGKWPDQPHLLRLAPAGWKKERLQAHQAVRPCYEESACSVSDTESRSTWAKRIAQVYEVDPLVCPCCSAPIRTLDVITEPQEVRKILRHLVKIGRSPPEYLDVLLQALHLHRGGAGQLPVRGQDFGRRSADAQAAGPEGLHLRQG